MDSKPYPLSTLINKTQHMPNIKLTQKAWERLKAMEETEGYETHSAAIMEMLHQHQHSARIPRELSEEAKGALRNLAETHKDLIAVVDELPQPMRDIAKFLKAVADGEV